MNSRRAAGDGGRADARKRSEAGAEGWETRAKKTRTEPWVEC